MSQQVFLKTEHFVYTFSIDSDRLKGLIKTGELVRNVHFIIPPFAKKRKYFQEILWDTDNMRKWLKNQDNKVVEIDSEVLSLLQRR